MSNDKQAVIRELRIQTALIESKNKGEHVQNMEKEVIDDTVPTRKCTLCRKFLPLGRFERDPSNKLGGRRESCMECESQREVNLIEQKKARRKAFVDFQKEHDAWTRISQPRIPRDKKSRIMAKVKRDKHGRILATPWNSFGRGVRSRYGTDVDTLYSLKRRQMNCCRCCGLPRPTVPLKKRNAGYRELKVDFIKETSTIVGLVCWRCAPIIKKARKRRDILTDLPDRVMAKCVADYLELPPIEIFS